MSKANEIARLAEELVQHVNSANLTKVAQAEITRQYGTPMETEIGKMLYKLAQSIKDSARHTANDVTVEDLSNFLYRGV